MISSTLVCTFTLPVHKCMRSSLNSFKYYASISTSDH